MRTRMLITMLLAVVATAMPVEAKKCPVDSVQVGVACVDKYEASVWNIPAANPNGKSNAGLIRRVQKGAVTLAQLMSGSGTRFPGAVVRGGRYDSGMAAREGIYAITGDIPPTGGVMHLGFRCAR